MPSGQTGPSLPSRNPVVDLLPARFTERPVTSSRYGPVLREMSGTKASWIPTSRLHWPLPNKLIPPSLRAPVVTGLWRPQPSQRTHPMQVRALGKGRHSHPAQLVSCRRHGSRELHYYVQMLPVPGPSHVPPQQRRGKEKKHMACEVMFPGTQGQSCLRPECSELSPVSS